LFVTVIVSDSATPTFTFPKLNAVVLKLIGAAEALPSRLTNSSASVASVCISKAPVRSEELAAVAGAALPGVKARAILQLSPGKIAPHVVVDIKSDGVSSPPTWITFVPVFVRVIDWKADASPTCVFANVNALSSST
jgi:hypothetical protein